VRELKETTHRFIGIFASSDERVEYTVPRDVLVKVPAVPAHVPE